MERKNILSFIKKNKKTRLFILIFILIFLLFIFAVDYLPATLNSESREESRINTDHIRNSNNLQVALENYFKENRIFCNNNQISCGKYSFMKLAEKLGVGLEKDSSKCKEEKSGGGIATVSQEGYTLEAYDSRCEKVIKTIKG